MSSLCSRHPEAATTFTCPRCGSFGCVDCERRAQVDAAPMCPGCWARQPTAPASSGTALQTIGLVIGVLSVVCCPLMLVSVPVNIVAIVMAKEPAARAARWRPIVGLVLTLTVGLLGLFVSFYQVFQRSTQ